MKKSKIRSKFTNQWSLTPLIFIIKLKWIFLYGILSMILLTTNSCSQYMDYKENQHKENFNKNFEIFQKLEQMQREDIKLISGVSLDKVFAYPDSKKLSQKRIEKYRNLMRQIEIESFEHITEEPEKRMVRFYAHKERVDYGYVYMEYPPPRFFNKLSECEPIMPSQSCYILLRKNWYIFSERYRLKQE